MLTNIIFVVLLSGASIMVHSMIHKYNVKKIQQATASACEARMNWGVWLAGIAVIHFIWLSKFSYGFPKGFKELLLKLFVILILNTVVCYAGIAVCRMRGRIKALNDENPRHMQDTVFWYTSIPSATITISLSILFMQGKPLMM